MKAIFKGTRCRGYMLDAPSWIIRCTAHNRNKEVDCEFERTAETEESAQGLFFRHCVAAGDIWHWEALNNEPRNRWLPSLRIEISRWINERAHAFGHSTTTTPTITASRAAEATTPAARRQ